MQYFCIVESNAAIRFVGDVTPCCWIMLLLLTFRQDRRAFIFRGEGTIQSLVLAYDAYDVSILDPCI